MSEARKISISVSQSLLEEMDSMAKAEETNRSQFIRDAVQAYIEARKQRQIRESLRQGYEKMASLNRNMAESCISAENEGCEVLLQDLT